MPARISVDRVVDLRRVPAGGDDAERLVAHVAQHRLVERGHAADRRDLAAQTVLVELPQAAEAVRAGEAEEDAVDVGLELRDVGAVVGHGERREHLLHDLAAAFLEHALEAGAHLVAVGDVVGDHRHAAVLERLVAVVGERRARTATRSRCRARTRDWACAASCPRRRRPTASAAAALRM